MYVLINEQSIKWIASMYVRFVGFKKACPESVDRNAL